MKPELDRNKIVAPSRARGLKLCSQSRSPHQRPGRAFTGAWIETWASRKSDRSPGRVAPSRARGLKHRTDPIGGQQRLRRAFTGAWIETHGTASSSICSSCRAFTGAWIETVYFYANRISFVAPSRARGLKRLAISLTVISSAASRLHGRVD